jgi:hypothetical protein
VDDIGGLWIVLGHHFVHLFRLITRAGLGVPEREEFNGLRLLLSILQCECCFLSKTMAQIEFCCRLLQLFDQPVAKFTRIFPDQMLFFNSLKFLTCIP